MTQARKLLVTSALPYANGHLHLGHLVEHIQTDIWVRAHKMLGHDCIAICGDDAHGTPIMLKARGLGISPEELTEQMRASHEADFAAFSIHYDNYHSTHCEDNRTLVSKIYEKLKTHGDIVERTISQAFDPEKQMFLPDRFIKGTCPRCKTPDQYGDNCESCGATYDPTELINPYSVLSGTTPIEKETVHYFFDLPKYEELLRHWMDQGALQSEVTNKLNEWFENGLRQWDISRDAPYFGFPIPDADNKFFYVWMDAPVGYMSSFKQYCDKQDVDFEQYWGKDSEAELYHFIGKDIVYFHALFWPAVLHSSGYRMPTAIFSHGFLTVNGQKMSKSRGTFIEAKDYLAHLNPAYLRYYFAAKLNGRVDDIDLNFDDFCNRVNADLVGKVINIASRCAGFINKRFEGRLSDTLADPDLYVRLLENKSNIIDAYIDRDYAKAVRMIMENADVVNQYIDHHKPWVMAKDETQMEQVQGVCSMGIQAFRLLMAFLKPILPDMAAEVETFLRCQPLTWHNIDQPLLGHTINPFKPLLNRVDKTAVEELLNK